MAETVREGGCLCGAVRFRAEGEPESTCWCHCMMCRRASGSPAVAWATYRGERVSWSGSAPARYDSSAIAERGFCSRCGGALSFQYKAQRERIDLATGCFDEPAGLAPAKHLYTSTRLPWMDAGAALPAWTERAPPGK